MIAAILWALAFRRDSASTSTTGAAGNSVAVFDSNSNKLVADIAVGATPTRMVVGEDAYWVTNADDHSVLEDRPFDEGRGRHDRRGQQPERHYNRCGRGLGDQQPGWNRLANRSRHQRRGADERRRQLPGRNRLRGRLDLGSERRRRDDNENRRA